MVKNIFFVLALIISIPSHSKMTIPNNLGELCTPSDKDFKEYRYKEKIPVCERNVTSSMKNKVCKRDGVNNRSGYIVNHVISLFAGGNNSIDNLYCQPKSRNTAEQELQLYNQLKADKIGIEEVRIQLKEMNDNLISELNND